MSEPTPNWADLTREQREAIIRPLWLDGKSAGEITHYFIGASRNAVIGVVTRAKMGKRAQRTNTDRAPKPAKPREATKPRPAINRLPMAAPAFVSFVPQPDPDTVRPGAFNPITDTRPPIEGVSPISILELPSRTGGRCRFPVVGGYCGAVTETTYCVVHSRYAFNPRSENGSLARKR